MREPCYPELALMAVSGLQRISATYLCTTPRRRFGRICQQLLQYCPRRDTITASPLSRLNSSCKEDKMSMVVRCFSTTRCFSATVRLLFVFAVTHRQATLIVGLFICFQAIVMTCLRTTSHERFGQTSPRHQLALLPQLDRLMDSLQSMGSYSSMLALMLPVQTLPFPRHFNA